jgi:hypothetical protein
MSVLKDTTALISTIGVAVAVCASPSLAAEPEGETERAPTANGDGYLSEDELAALANLPIGDVTGADLADVTETDLARLPQALQDRIMQPVQQHFAASGVPAAGLGRSPSATLTKQVQGQWWTVNSFGWHLTDYFIAISFSYNGSKVIDASNWSWGNGNWGYQFCGEDARGSRWVNSSHTHYQAFGRGKFGPPGCDIITVTNGGTLNVNGSGHGWLS